MLTRTKQHVIALFLLLAILQSTPASATLFLTIDTPTIDQNSIYEFQFVDSGAWSQTGVVQITFQSPPYAFANSTTINSCKETVLSTYTLNCYASSSSSISFSWTAALVAAVSSSAGDSLTMAITLQNPSYVDNFNIAYTFTLTNGVQYSSGSTTLKSLVADTLTSCAVTFSPNYTNSLATVNIQFTPKNAIPAGGSIFFTAVGYTVGNTLTSINTLSNSALNSSAGISNSGQTYILTNFFTSGISSGASISFSVSSVMSPSTTALSTYSFNLTTLYTSSYLNSIDTKLCYLSVADYPITLSITFSSTFYVGDSLRPNLTYTTPVALVLSTDTYNFIVDSSSTSYLSVATANSAGSGGYIPGASATLYMSNMTNGVTFPSTVMSDTFNSNTSIVISGGMTIKSLINSGSKTVSFQVFRNRNSYAYAKTTILIKPNSLMSASVSMLSTTVSALATYTFTFVVKNPLSTGAGMRVTLPSDLYINTGTCSASVSSPYGSVVSTNVSCTATSNTVIFITNMVTNTFPSNNTLVVTVTNIMNPISIKTTGTFLLETFYSSSQLTNSVDDSSSLTGLTVTATYATIPSANFVISRNSTVNMQYAVYTIAYTVVSRFKANGYLTVSFPSYMTLNTTNGCSYTAKDSSTNLTSTASITPTETVSGSLNVLTFNFSSLIQSNLAAGSIITITISTLRNYYSFKTVYSQLITYSNDGNMVEQSSTTAASITNTVQDTSLPVILTTSATKINGNPTNSTFSITPPSNMAISDVICAELQNTGNVNTQMYYSSSPTCVVGGTTSSCSIDSSNSKLLNISLGAALTASTTYTFSIANIILSRSFDTPGKIYFRIFEVSASKLYNISSATISPSSNTQTNVIKTVSLSIDDNSGTSPSQLNQLQKFTVTMSAFNGLQSGDIVIITVPSQYTYVPSSKVTVTNTSDLTTMSGSLCVDSTLFCSNYNGLGNSIRVVEKVPGNVFTNISSLSVTIVNGTFQSPTSWTDYNSERYLVNTYSSTGQSIDAVQSGTTTNATFYLYCSTVANHCGTCLATGVCQSCYALGTGYDKNITYGSYYYITSTGICVQSCGGNFYNSSNSCIQCSAPCYGCIGSATTCTSCVNTTINGVGPFYYYNSTCQTTCPNGYYPDTGNVCSPCSSPCLTCSSNVVCTSCYSNKYLSTRLGTCGDSIICNATYQFADSSAWKCSNCSVSCTTCSINSTWCATCASGYIPDYNYGSTQPGRCTNVCKSGTVNDTANAVGGGCTCNYTACASCQTTINTCLTCNGSKYIQSGSCVSSCSSGYYTSGTSCVACAGNCSACNLTTCTQCSSNLYLYQGVCISSCPSYTTSGLSSGVSICYSCGSFCLTCFDSSNCQTCANGTYTQISSTRACVTQCSTGFLAYNSQCLTSCPSGTSSVGSNCQTNTNSSTSTNTSTTNSTITTSLTTSTSRIIPFPYTIGLGVLTIATFISKLGLSHTIVSAGLCAFGGLMQLLSWVTLMIVEGVDPTTSTNPGLYVVLIAFLLNLFLNILSLYFFKKYVWPDERFQGNFKKLKDKTKTGACVTYTCIILSGIFSHKFVEILFSNLFESAFFVYKISDKLKLSPLNYIRYVSFLPSIIAIIGGGISSYDMQTLSLSSLVFIQSIDLIIVTVFSGIFSVLVTIRKPEEYETNLAEKRNDIEEELDHDILGDNVFHLEEEEKQANKLSKYRHKSSIIVEDPREDPIGRKNLNRKNPIGEELNFTNAALGEREDDENRLNLHDFTGSSKMGKNSKRQNEIDIDQINFVEEEGDNALPPSKFTGRRANNAKNGIKNAAESQRYSKRQKNEDPGKNKLKENIQTKLTEEQIQKTKIVRDVDRIDTTSLEQDKKLDGSESNIKDQSKNEKKKSQLEILSNSNPESLSKIPEKDRAKAGEMKNAMKILNAKKIEIGEYLEYLDIIEQQDEDVNSDDYDSKQVKLKKGNLNGNRKRPNGTSTKKTQKRDRTARKVDDQLVVSIGGGQNMYDDDLEPEIPDFHQTPIKGRKLSEANFNPNDEEFSNNYSSLKKNQNRSDQQFSKKNGLNDLVLVSLQSGENYDKSLAEEFQKGNALKQVQKDELPPSNLYATEKFTLDNKQTGSLNNSIPMSRDRIVPNTLINDQTQIEYLESDGGDQQTIKGELLDFNNDVSPSHFNQPNMRIENDELSEAPTKPKITKRVGEKKVGQVENIQDEEDIEGYDEFNHEYDNLPDSKLERYQSNQGMLDYDDIIYQRKNNQKVKQLQKIYLQRQNVNRRGESRKPRKNYSSQSYRKEQS